MSSKFGFERLTEQACEFVSQLVAVPAEYIPYGETPIEKLFAWAFYWRAQLDHCAWKVNFVHGPKFQEYFLDHYDPENEIAVVFQAQLDKWRVDFLVIAYCFGTLAEQERGWKRLIVECDGHDFHERTKEQAAKDRSRDREYQSKGYPVFRFTGSELWRDPWACATQVLRWVEGVR